MVKGFPLEETSQMTTIRGDIGILYSIHNHEHSQMRTVRRRDRFHRRAQRLIYIVQKRHVRMDDRPHGQLENKTDINDSYSDWQFWNLRESSIAVSYNNYNPLPASFLPKPTHLLASDRVLRIDIRLQHSQY